jgi:hypothetical protein
MFTSAGCKSGFDMGDWGMDMEVVGAELVKWWISTQSFLKSKIEDVANTKLDLLSVAAPARATLDSPLLLTVADLTESVLVHKPRAAITALTAEVHALRQAIQAIPFIDPKLPKKMKSAIAHGRYAVGVAYALQVTEDIKKENEKQAKQKLADDCLAQLSTKSLTVPKFIADILESHGSKKK